MKTLESMLREGAHFSNRRGPLAFAEGSSASEKIATEIQHARDNANISVVLAVFKAYGIREGISPEEHMAEVKAKHFDEFKKLYVEKHCG